MTDAEVWKLLDEFQDHIDKLNARAKISRVVCTVIFVFLLFHLWCGRTEALRTTNWWILSGLNLFALTLNLSAVVSYRSYSRHWRAFYIGIKTTLESEPGSLRFNCALEQAEAAAKKIQ